MCVVGSCGGIILLLFNILDSFAQATVFPQPLSPRIANYDIDARLDTKTRMLKAQQVLVWHNKSNDVISEMQFHLYLNAFRNTRSTYMKESGRGRRIGNEGFGFIEVSKIALASGEDLTAKMEFIQPDDGNADDRTVFRLPLPAPLKPGESIKLHFDLSAKLPQPPYERTGAQKEFFFVAQWFPKVGVWQDEQNAWNCHQFHANSEFFADFGVYNVRMTVPAENIVGATGLVQSVTDNGDGTKTHFYHAEDVHDFAWTTSPEFKEFFAEQNDVSIRLLMQPDQAHQAQRHLEAAKVAVKYHEEWYGDYPFPNLTVVAPRRGARGAGGMEYPTLITAETAYGQFGGVRLVELVIIHEFGHNFWYHLLASNEFEESWLDEGITSYAESRIMQEAYGTGSAINLCGIKLDDQQLFRAFYISNPSLDPTLRKAWEYYSGASYEINSYQKPGTLLFTLENYLGTEIMRRCMQEYVRRWRFKHPTTKDFIQVFNETSGQNLDWFFNQALHSRATLDYSVDQILSREIQKPRGFDYTMKTADTIAPSSQENDGGKTDSINAQDDSAKKIAPKIYESQVNIRRLGEFVFPVEALVKFDDGGEVREQWDGRELWKKFTYQKPAKLVYATVDPDKKIWLDINMINNSKTLELNSLGANKLSARWMFWMQFLLDSPEWLLVVQRLLSF
jgi:hypothetical protein